MELANSGGLPQAMGHIFARQEKLGPVTAHPAHDHMHVRVIGVVMIDGHPMESNAEVPFHPLHHVAGEAFEIVAIKANPALGGQHDTKMPAVVDLPLPQLLTRVLHQFVLTIIETAPLAFTRRAVTFQILRVRQKLAATTAAASVIMETHLGHDALAAIAAEGS